MRWNKKEDDKLKNLYFNRSLSIEEISARLERPTASVNNRLSRISIKRNRSLRKFKTPTEVTPALARIHAHICGDGCLFQTREKDDYGYLRAYRRNYYRKTYKLDYTNNCHHLIKEFVQDIYSTFGVKARIGKGNARLKNKQAWLYLKNLGAGNSYSWNVPRQFLMAGNDIKRNWLCAYFDDEAHFGKDKRIRAKSVNLEGLKQVLVMLKTFMPAHITPTNGKKYTDGTYYLNINKKYWDTFFKEIGSLKYSLVSKNKSKI